jgi:hypothetical protein
MPAFFAALVIALVTAERFTNAPVPVVNTRSISAPS